MTKNWIVEYTGIWPKGFFLTSWLDIQSSSSNLPFICWENRWGENQIKFTSIPYFFLENCQLQYYQGGNNNVGKKKKFCETQQEKLTCDQVNQSKLKKLTQSSKEIRCPVAFAVMKIYSFPEHKNSSDTKRQGTEQMRL